MMWTTQQQNQNYNTSIIHVDYTSQLSQAIESLKASTNSSNCIGARAGQTSCSNMAPSAPLSRKAKRKNEREEKKRSRNKRQRRTDDAPALVPAHQKGAKHRDGNSGAGRKRPQAPSGGGSGGHKSNGNRIQNKFHELLQETTGLSSASTGPHLALSTGH